MNEWITLNELYNAYLECRQRKRNTKSCALFEMNEASNLYALYKDLNNKTYKIGKSIVFVILYPKIREVFAADFRDRIVHHLLINKYKNGFANYFIDNSFSCIKGKGTYKCQQKALEYSEYYKDGWVLSCDIKGFFMSIDRKLLAKMLEDFVLQYGNKKYKYTNELLWLTNLIVLNEPENNCIKHGDLSLFDKVPSNRTLFLSNGNGLAIGNLTSQQFANFYLTKFDKWVIENFNVGYVRYVDDFRLFAHDKQTLLKLINKIRKFLKDELHLELHPCKIELQPVKHGFQFVGVHIKKNRIYINNYTISNCKKIIKLYNNLQDYNFELSVNKYAQRINSYLGYMIHYYTYAIRYNIINLISNRNKKYIHIGINKEKILPKFGYIKEIKLFKEYNDLRKH